MKKTIIFLLFALAVNIVAYAQDAFYYYDGKRIHLTENASKIVVISPLAGNASVNNCNLQFEKNISDKSFSRASASSYFIFEKSSLKDTIDYLDRNGYEYKIRPDIHEAPGENFLVRISDHNPRAYIITKDKTETVWDYTDASILVTFQKIGNRSVTTNQLNKKLKILQTKDI